MSLARQIDALDPISPWSAGSALPWNDPEFSQRMLEEHLSQGHDSGSRRITIIEQQIDWLQKHYLSDKKHHILDIGCGPGLYTERLAQHGHECTGIDFSPAAIKYAKDHTSDNPGVCNYIEGDITQVNYGQDYTFAMFLFGEFNAFQQSKAESVVDRAYQCLASGGRFLLEAFTYEYLEQLARMPSSQRLTKSSTFHPLPHTWISSLDWWPEQHALVESHTIVDFNTKAISRFANTLRAYTAEQYEHMLTSTGFEQIEHHKATGDHSGFYEEGLRFISALKP
ncbi:MAG: class I SAM-dependent methyltransferase [Wenzhouxiangellaceae bacterium]